MQNSPFNDKFGTIEEEQESEKFEVTPVRRSIDLRHIDTELNKLKLEPEMSMFKPPLNLSQIIPAQVILEREQIIKMTPRFQADKLREYISRISKGDPTLIEKDSKVQLLEKFLLLIPKRE